MLWADRTARTGGNRREHTWEYLSRAISLALGARVGPINATPGVELADLPSQFEDLLSAVWGAEANWRFDDRLDLAFTIGATARPTAA